MLGVLVGVVVAVRQHGVVVLVRVPIGPMVEVADGAGHTIAMVVGHVIVVMGVHHRRVSVGRGPAFTLGALDDFLSCHELSTPVKITRPAQSITYSLTSAPSNSRRISPTTSHTSNTWRASPAP